MSEDEAKKLLHDYHLKITKPRLRILLYLMTHHNHPTAEMIYHDIAKNKTTYRATIYNTLKTLVNVGIIIEIKNGDNSSHYDYFIKPHFHIICTNCGKIADVYYPNFNSLEEKMRTEAEKQTGFVTSTSHLEIYGLCPDCQKFNKKNKG
ncbi:Fur family transcriptional regulator [Lactobacillus sp. ESL0791]|uniref:Fur family transcriptional regulator n=1 Tax=Lactobacillus sp. ESL0791 TaxID=2983234 RepID=UPI0023F8866A|nr:Fur family transcriptional regulator [Lactobacillus sp. ESL0791]MDF7638602.1 Fur family transcriptional regulator [Lactobacillus sp. ESL0791]